MNDLQPTTPHPLSNANRRGFENESGKDDLLIPRAKLMQPLSPELDEHDLKAGQIVNSLTKEPLPSIFVPVFVFKEFLRFNPRDSHAEGYDEDFAPGALIWKTTDPADPRVKETQFGPHGEKPLAQSVLNFFSYFPGTDMPVIVGFSKSSYKAGKQLYSLTKFAGGDMFSRAYSLIAKQESNDAGKFWVLTVAPAGAASEMDYAAATALWSQFSAKAQTLHTDAVEETEAV